MSPLFNNFRFFSLSSGFNERFLYELQLLTRRDRPVRQRQHNHRLQIWQDPDPGGDLRLCPRSGCQRARPRRKLRLPQPLRGLCSQVSTHFFGTNINYRISSSIEHFFRQLRCGRTGRAGNKGYAVTFITPEQPRLAGEIIKAMENSEALVPAELRAVWNGYKAKMVRDRRIFCQKP